jgi:hypothetical protein
LGYPLEGEPEQLADVAVADSGVGECPNRFVSPIPLRYG